MSSGKAILTSCRPDEYSAEMPKKFRHSVFTHFLLEGLNGAADENGDTLVTLHEAYNYVYRHAKDVTKGIQHPQLENRVEGPFPLALARPADTTTSVTVGSSTSNNISGPISSESTTVHEIPKPPQEKPNRDQDSSSPAQERVTTHEERPKPKPRRPPSPSQQADRTTDSDPQTQLIPVVVWPEKPEKGNESTSAWGRIITQQTARDDRNKKTTPLDREAGKEGLPENTSGLPTCKDLIEKIGESRDRMWLDSEMGHPSISCKTPPQHGAKRQHRCFACLSANGEQTYVHYNDLFIPGLFKYEGLGCPCAGMGD